MEARTGRTGGAARGDRAYGRHVKIVLLIAAIAAGAAVGVGAQRATAQAPSGCVVPRLYALTLPAAQARLTAAGCKLGAIAFERPRTRLARVTGQVPAPGAALPRRTRISLLAS